MSILGVTFSINLGHKGDSHSVDLPGHHLCPGPHDCPDRPHPPGPVLQGQSPQGQVCPGHRAAEHTAQGEWAAKHKGKQS